MQENLPTSKKHKAAALNFIVQALQTQAKALQALILFLKKKIQDTYSFFNIDIFSWLI